MSDNNPFEMDLDIDEETGEVVLPRDYVPPSQRGLANPQVQTRPPRAITDGRADAGSGGPAPDTATTPPPIPYPSNDRLPAPTPCPDCPPCPSGGTPGGRMRSPDGSLIGLVIGLGMIGGVMWYAGKMLAPMGEADEDLDDIDALPGAPPRLLPAPVPEDVIEGTVVEED